MTVDWTSTADILRSGVDVKRRPARQTAVAFPLSMRRGKTHARQEKSDLRFSKWLLLILKRALNDFRSASRPLALCYLHFNGHHSYIVCIQYLKFEKLLRAPHSICKMQQTPHIIKGHLTCEPSEKLAANRPQKLLHVKRTGHERR